MIKLLVLLWRGWFVLVAVVGTIIFGGIFIFPFSFREKDYQIAYFFHRMWAFFVFYGSGLFYSLNVKDNTPFHNPYVVISNHTSMMDIMLMYILNKNPMVFVGKEELAKLPIFGPIFRRCNILVDRSDEKSRMKVLRQCTHKINLGYSICIFPEGGVPEEEVFLDEFKDGPFVVAALAQVPLVVYTFCGMKKRLPYGYFKGGPGKVNVFLNEIIPANKFNRKQTEEFKNYSREIILNQLKSCEN